MSNLNRFDWPSRPPAYKTQTRQRESSVGSRDPSAVPSPAIGRRAAACRRSIEYACDLQCQKHRRCHEKQYEQRDGGEGHDASGCQPLPSRRIRVGRSRRLRRVRRCISRGDASTWLNAWGVRGIGVWWKLSHWVTTCFLWRPQQQRRAPLCKPTRRRDRREQYRATGASGREARYRQ